MPESETATLLRNLDKRVAVIEQILPTLATKDDLKGFPTREDPKGFLTQEDLKVLATKEDLKAFATKEDLKAFATKADLERFATTADLERFATKADLDRFATKADLDRFATKEETKENLKAFATKEDLLEEGERSRRYMKVLVEAVHDTINSALDVQAAHTERLVEHSARLDGHDRIMSKIDLRVTAIERPRRRNR